MTITFLQPDGVAITAQAARQGSAAVYGGGAGRPLGGRSGFRVDTPSNVLTVTSTTWTLAPCAAMIDPGFATAQGMYGWATDQAVTGSVTASDATNTRMDIVYIQVNDSSAGDGSGAKTANVSYLAGAPSATPTPPALPARSFLVGTITVPKTGAGSPTVALNTARFSAAGGILQVSSQAERDALSGFDGLTVRRMDIASRPLENYDGTGWRRQIATLVQANTQTVGSGMATNAFTTGTLQPIIQAGTFVGTTTSSGDLTISYPTPFPNGVIGGIGFSGDGVYIVSGTPSTVAAPTTSSLFLRFANPNGSAVASAGVRGTWIAVGW